MSDYGVPGCPSCEARRLVHRYPDWQCDRHARQLGMDRPPLPEPRRFRIVNATWPELVAALLERNESNV